MSQRVSVVLHEDVCPLLPSAVARYPVTARAPFQEMEAILEVQFRLAVTLVGAQGAR